MLGKVQTYWFCTFERCDSICFIYPVLCFFLIARLRLDLHLMKLRKWCHCKFYPYPYLWLQTNVLEKGLSHRGIFASWWPALPSVPACCNSKFTHICISSNRKNLLVLTVRVLGLPSSCNSEFTSRKGKNLLMLHIDIPTGCSGRRIVAKAFLPFWVVEVAKKM